MNTKSDNYLLATLWTLLGMLGRVLPHLPNVTPTSPLALFGGTQMPLLRALSVTFLGLLLSDIALAAIYGYAVFGSWTFFTYTGFGAIVLAGRLLRNNPSAGRTLALLLASTLGYWLWTNFGVWLLAPEGVLYPRTLEGLLACYAMALPFLRNALIGDMAWGLVLFVSFAAIRKMAPRYGWSVQGA